jgi:hypothetical protein
MPRKSPSSVYLLRDLTDAIERVGEVNVRSLLRGAAGSASNGSRKGNLVGEIRKGKGEPRRLRRDLIESVAQQLQILDSTEAGSRCLEDADLSRRELEALARSIDVPVRKDIRVADLEDLIVNVTIGGRLNSLAIRGGSSLR